MSRVCSARCDYFPVCPCGGQLPEDAADGRWSHFAPDERAAIELAIVALARDSPVESYPVLGRLLVELRTQPGGGRSVV